MIKTLLILSLTVLSNTLLHAKPIEVYLNRSTSLSGIDEAKAEGHTLIFYYMDDIHNLEGKLAARLTQKYQQHIAELVEQEGLKTLVQLSEPQRNQLLLKQLDESGINLESLSQMAVTSHDKEAINQAFDNLVYAENNGVTPEMLPAILFKGQLHKNTSNLFDVLESEGEKK